MADELTTLASVAPSTPAAKRKAADMSPTKQDPNTPTPFLVGMMTAPYSTGDIDDAAPPPGKRFQIRKASPHITNVPLHTPSGAQLTAGPPVSSQLQLSATQDITTTENLLERACAHLLAADPRLKPAIDAHYCHVFSPEGLAEEVDPFRSLCSGIMAQQVSGAAASAIKKRFVALFNDDDGSTPAFPTPAQVAASDVPRLKLAGLSGRKAEYIILLAEKFESGELSATMLAAASDDEVLEKLTACKGLGKWSVEMFACFALKRMDILSTGDLGVQ